MRTLRLEATVCLPFTHTRRAGHFHNSTSDFFFPMSDYSPIRLSNLNLCHHGAVFTLLNCTFPLQRSVSNNSNETAHQQELSVVLKRHAATQSQPYGLSCRCPWSWITVLPWKAVLLADLRGFHTPLLMDAFIAQTLWWKNGIFCHSVVWGVFGQLAVRRQCFSLLRPRGLSTTLKG